MGTKMAAAFGNIFMSKVETQILNQTHFNHLHGNDIRPILTLDYTRNRKSRVHRKSK